MFAERSSLGRWNYEPYGIAVSRSVLQRLGAREVIYGDKHLFEQLSPEEKPYYQFKGMDNTDEQLPAGWESEAEWRLAGDLDLMSIKDDVIIITPFESEAETLQELLPYRIHSLER